jgi:uncharacterized protein
MVFTGSCGYRHESTEHAGRSVVGLAAEAGVDAYATGDPAVFTDRELDNIDAVVWVHTSGTGNLDGRQRAAYERFTAAGGGFAGVHAAAGGERDWPLFSRLVGARFVAHPPGTSPATVRRHGPHPSVDHLPDRWPWVDEWYSFDASPTDRRLLLTLDVRSVDMGDLAMPVPHPLSWSGTVGAARAWYTALGHETTAYDAPGFRSHLWGGIASVLRTRPPVDDPDLGQVTGGST